MLPWPRLTAAVAARAIATLCRSPPESVDGNLLGQLLQPKPRHRLLDDAASRCSLRLRTAAPNAMFRRTRQVGKQCEHPGPPLRTMRSCGCNENLLCRIGHHELCVLKTRDDSARIRPHKSRDRAQDRCLSAAGRPKEHCPRLRQRKRDIQTRALRARCRICTLRCGGSTSDKLDLAHALAAPRNRSPATPQAKPQPAPALSGLPPRS